MTAPLALTGPLLLFGGPYSNLEATRAVLAEAERRQIPPERIVCTGDVVAYGADAKATVDLVRASAFAWSWATAKRRCPWEQQTAAAALPPAAPASGSQPLGSPMPIGNSMLPCGPGWHRCRAALMSNSPA